MKNVEEGLKKPKIAGVAFGENYAKRAVEEMEKLSTLTIEPALLGGASIFAAGLQEDVLDCDLIYVVMEGSEVSLENLGLVEQIINRSRALATGICIGEIPTQKSADKFETITKAFYFREENGIHKYIALLANMIGKAIQPDTLVGIDLIDLQQCLRGNRNYVWIWKSYGKDKGSDIANHFMKSDQYKKIQEDSCKAILVIITGDISLYDANEAFSPISDKVTNNSHSLLAVAYDETVYEEMSMLVIDSE